MSASQPFRDIPTKKPARVRTLRNARMGTRAVVTSPEYPDAFRTFTVVQRLAEAFDAEKSNVTFFDLLSNAWRDRK